MPGENGTSVEDEKNFPFAAHRVFVLKNSFLSSFPGTDFTKILPFPYHFAVTFAYVRGYANYQRGCYEPHQALSTRSPLELLTVFNVER